jgi:hypothetical protein
VNNHARACVNDVTNHLGVGEYGFFNLPCRTTEYGSWMSIMGKNAGTSATHVHAGTMYDMHLLHLTDVHVIKSSGTYTIKPLNSLTTTGGTDKRAAVVQFTDQHVASYLGRVSRRIRRGCLARVGRVRGEHRRSHSELGTPGT